MSNKFGMFSGMALVLVSTSAVPAATANEDCAVLDQLYQAARTDFPALKQKGFGGARCLYRSHDYTCAWSFSTDRFAEAETQKDRLQRCTAAQPQAKAISANRGEEAFQINPETSVVIRGPDPNDGNWKIQIKVKTPADWN